MPVSNAVFVATLRRHWPVFGAVIMFVIFYFGDRVLFQPAVQRYQRSVTQAKDLGMPVEPDAAPVMLPPRLFALLSDNSMPEAQARELGASGALSATLIQDLTNLTSRHGIRVQLTEPGTISELPQGVLVRASLKLSCTYTQIVTLLDDMSKGPTLYSIDRFSITSQGRGQETAELWISRLVLKQQKKAR